MAPDVEVFIYIYIYIYIYSSTVKYESIDTTRRSKGVGGHGSFVLKFL